KRPGAARPSIVKKDRPGRAGGGAPVVSGVAGVATGSRAASLEAAPSSGVRFDTGSSPIDARRRRGAAGRQWSVTPSGAVRGDDARGEVVRVRGIARDTAGRSDSTSRGGVLRPI